MGCDNSKKRNKGNKNPKPLVVSNNPEKIKTGEISAKIILLGDSGVGKSSIAARFVKNEFSENYEVTISGAYLEYQLTTKNNTKVKLHIWDTGGAERFRSMAHNYYQSSIAAILVYDITKKRTLDGINYWLNDLSTHENVDRMILILAANKSDKQPEDELIIPLGEQYAENNSMLFYITSALTGNGIREAFTRIAEELVIRGLY